MSESYRVDTAIFMNSNVLQVMEVLAREMQEFDSIISATTEGVTRLETTIRALGEQSSSIRAMASAMRELNEATRASGGGSAGGGGRGGRGGGGGAGGGSGGGGRNAADGLNNEEWRAMRAEASYMDRDVDMRSQRVHQLASYEDGVVNARIGREQALSDYQRRDAEHMNRERDAVLRREEAAAHRNAGHGHHDNIMTAMLAQQAGEGVLHYAEHALKASGEVQSIQTLIAQDRRVGKGAEPGVDEITKHARDLTGTVLGSTIAGNLEAFVDVKNTVGSGKEALEALPAFVELTRTLRLLGPEHGGTGGDQSLAAARAVEVFGHFIKTNPDGTKTPDMAMMMQQTREMLRIAVATNNRVKPSDFLNFAKTSRVGGMMLNDQALYRDMPALMALSPSRTGTAIMSAFQLFQGNKETAATYKSLQAMGLVEGHMAGKGKKEHFVRTGQGLVGNDELISNPVRWVKDVLVPALSSHGKNQDEQLTWLASSMQRSTIAGLFGDIIKDLPAIEKEGGIMGHPEKGGNIENTNPDALLSMQETYRAKVEAFDASLNLLEVTLADTLMGPATGWLTTLTADVRWFAEVCKANPALPTYLTETGVALGGLALVGGTLGLALLPAAGLLRTAGSTLGLVSRFGRAVTGVGETAGAAASRVAAIEGSLGELGVDAAIAAPGLVAFAAGVGAISMAAMAVFGAYEFFKTAGDRLIPGSSMVREPEGANEGGLDGSMFGIGPAAPRSPASVNLHSAGGNGLGGYGGQPVQMHGNLVLDKQVMGRFTASTLASGATAPPVGITGPNVRLNPQASGLTLPGI